MGKTTYSFYRYRRPKSRHFHAVFYTKYSPSSRSPRISGARTKKYLGSQGIIKVLATVVTHQTTLKPKAYYYTS